MKLQAATILLCCTAGLAAARAQTSAILPPDKAAAETASILSDLIKIDTQDPPGNESKVATYIASIFQRESIPYDILEPVPGRASIVARLQGTGAQKPILLLAHEDVVPVDRSHWTVDPFAAELHGEVLYGRGASDDKGPLAAHIETMLQLHRSHQHLSRDIIFLAEASEETSSPAGMQTIVDRYWPKIACEFALNEGGAAEVTNGKIPYIGIATGEKLPRAVRLTATGHSGHASVPVLDNPITHLAQAVARLAHGTPPPTSTTPPAPSSPASPPSHPQIRPLSSAISTPPRRRRSSTPPCPSSTP
ncbi:MAG: M20/M25/M40 family metallo-hydrolase [Acidobacteria bacterium]|nr:M20/M25/M40 family metallo-hydrolase [Acidobacteriota bacterium]